MAPSLVGRSLLTLNDYSREEITTLLDIADSVKREKSDGRRLRRFEGYTIALLFEKRSTRTRCAFETAIAEEGGYPAFLSNTDIHLGEKETIEDTARVLGRMFDAIQFRGYSQQTAEALARWSGVPVYNGLTDSYHPTQVLADLMTIREVFGSLAGRTVAFVGDGRNNVARSLMLGCAKLGVAFTVVAPKALHPDAAFTTEASEAAEVSGVPIVVTDDLSGVEHADVVYTDVWISMGEEARERERVEVLSPYRVDDALIARAGKDSLFLHCLPAVRGNEVTTSVIDGPNSRVWDQAENRKHTIKAVMLATLGLL
ncbi:MAG: ornithine carbamoyltransferase [Spirochaetaceae bacterium]|nr:MAG: ornithine carbamoyltransferase [Spirochaetaceae bacterium]